MTKGMVSFVSSMIGLIASLLCAVIIGSLSPKADRTLVGFISGFFGLLVWWFSLKVLRKRIVSEDKN